MMYKILLSGALLFVVPQILASQPMPSSPAEGTTISGISAGAQMAHQLHIAYPDIFSGVGLIAGGPFGCAEGSLSTALTRCMGSVSGELPLTEFEAQIKAAENAGQIGNTALLSNDRVWVFHGSEDTTVAAELSDATVALYSRFLSSENIRIVNDVGAGHNFPTLSAGTDCGATESPFIGRCDYDAAESLLKQLYGKLEAPAAELKTELIKTKLPGALAAGLDENAYLFIPEECEQTGQSCKTHLVLHGCAQSSAQIGTVFIEQSGYLPWAEANNIVLAFPQVAPATANPFACWDWWGYTGKSYRWRDGAQMKVLADWMRELAVR